VEGHELQVLRGLSLERHRPNLVLIEDAVRDLDQHRYLRSHGYRLVKRTALNNWYIPENAAFSMATLGERIGLFRKMYLATPIGCSSAPPAVARSVTFLVRRKSGERRASPARSCSGGPAPRTASSRPVWLRMRGSIGRRKAQSRPVAEAAVPAGNPPSTSFPP